MYVLKNYYIDRHLNDLCVTDILYRILTRTVKCLQMKITTKRFVTLKSVEKYVILLLEVDIYPYTSSHTVDYSVNVSFFQYPYDYVE